MKSFIGFLVFVVCITLVTPAPGEVPKTFKTCHKSDPQFNQCINGAIQNAIVQLAPGLRSMKVVPIEPLQLDSISIGGSQGTVTLKQDFKNVKLYGLTKGLKVISNKIDWDKAILYSEAHNPQVDFVANYKLNGKVLLLPITGTGKSNITMIDLKTTNKIICEKIVKDNETYWKPVKYEIRFFPRKTVMKFENLFNGDKVLGEQMNQFINENADLLFKELQGPYEESFGLVFKQLTENIFTRVPISKIFPD